MKKWFFGLLILTILAGVTGGYMVSAMKKDSSDRETYVYAEWGDHKLLEGLEIEVQEYTEHDTGAVEWTKEAYHVVKGAFVKDSATEELSLSEYRKRVTVGRLAVPTGSVYTTVSIDGEEENRVITVSDRDGGGELFRVEIGDRTVDNAVCIGGENCGVAYLPSVERYYAIFRSESGTWKADEYSVEEAKNWFTGSKEKVVAYDGSRLVILVGDDAGICDFNMVILKEGKIVFRGLINSSGKGFVPELTTVRFR